jgi:hypothetical protein
MAPEIAQVTLDVGNVAAMAGFWSAAPSRSAARLVQTWASGATKVSDVLADPEGNELCILHRSAPTIPNDPSLTFGRSPHGCPRSRRRVHVAAIVWEISRGMSSQTGSTPESAETPEQVLEDAKASSRRAKEAFDAAVRVVPAHDDDQARHGATGRGRVRPPGRRS